MDAVSIALSHAKLASATGLPVAASATNVSSSHRRKLRKKHVQDIALGARISFVALPYFARLVSDNMS